MEVAKVVEESEGRQLTEKEINHQIKLAVERVSESGVYQKKIIVFLMILSLFVSLSTIGTPFFYMNPIFECEGIEGIVNEEVACRRRDTCTLKNGFTLASHMDLVCGNKKEARNLIQTATGLGTWGGIFLAGIIGDWKGKRLGLVLSIGMAALASFLRILGAYMHSLIVMIVCETLTGIAYKSITMLSFIMMTRFLTVPHYEVSSIAWYIAGGGLGQIIIAMLNQFFPAWLNFAMLLFIPLLLLFFVSYFLLEEDPIFLFGIGKYDECREVVNRVGERNNASLEALGHANLMIHQMEALVVAAAESKGKESLDLNPTISRPTSVPKMKLKINFELVFFFLALGCCGLCSNLTFTCLQYGVQSLGSSYSINLVTMGIAEMTGYFTMTLLIRRDINRKSGIIFSSLIYCTLGLLFIFPFTSQSDALQTILVFTLRYFGCWIYSFFARMKVDSFPQKLQTSLMGVIELLSNIGKIIGPTLVQMSTDHNINPITSSNFIRILIGTIPIFFIDEEILTNPPMEEHVEDEKDMKDQKD